MTCLGTKTGSIRRLEALASGMSFTKRVHGEWYLDTQLNNQM
jgi:hypothetical protein